MSKQLQIRTRGGAKRLEYRTANGQHQTMGPAIPSTFTDSELQVILCSLRKQIPPGTYNRRTLLLAAWCEALTQRERQR